MSNTSNAFVYNPNAIYTFGLINRGWVIGGGSVYNNAVRTWDTNITDQNQQWFVVELNTTNEYRYLLKLRSTGFYLDTSCEFTATERNCARDEVNRARLTQKSRPEDMPDTGIWRVQPSSDNDGSYYWWNKQNKTASRLDVTEDRASVYMNSNKSAGFGDGVGGSWRLSQVSTVAVVPTTSTIPDTSPTGSPSGAPSGSGGLSGGAIGGIVAGIVVGLLVVGALVGFWCLRRRRNAKAQPTALLPANDFKSSSAPSHPEMGYYGQKTELATPYNEPHEFSASHQLSKNGHATTATDVGAPVELASNTQPSSELYQSSSPVTRPPAELPTSRN